MTKLNWTPSQEETVGKWIMILLAANNFKPIRGRLRIIKELFKLAKETSSELDEAIYFYRYTYGPYSSRAGLKMNKFRKGGIIFVRYTGRDWEYSISDDYKAIAKVHLDQLNSELREQVKGIKKEFQDMSSADIVHQIYSNYPEFTTRSAIAKEVIATKTIDQKLVDSNVDESKLVVSLTQEFNFENDDTTIELRRWPENIRS